MDLDPLAGPFPSDEAAELRAMCGFFAPRWQQLLRRAAARLDPEFLYAGRPIHRKAVECRNEEIDDLRAENRQLRDGVKSLARDLADALRVLDDTRSRWAEARLQRDEARTALDRLRAEAAKL